MKDVLDRELQLYLRDLLPEQDALAQEMIAYAEEHHVSVVEPEVANLLQFLVGMQQPKHVLEIGTAIGFSTIAMAKALPKGGRITTIELVEERHNLAKENFARAGVADRIEAILGDAREVMPTLTGPYDMIFWDAAKGQYPEFLTIADRTLTENGLLIADNVLLNGWVYTLDYPRHRQKTMVYRMKEFLESFRYSDRFACTVLPLGDGVACIRRKGES